MGVSALKKGGGGGHGPPGSFRSLRKSKEIVMIISWEDFT